MRKTWLLALVVFLAFCLGTGAFAEELPEALIRELLLTTVSEDQGEFGAVGYALLGQKQEGRDWYLYLAASVGRYGYRGGYCTEFSGWGGPCTLVFQQINGEWVPKEVLEIEDYSEIKNIMPKEMERKFLNGKYDSQRIEEMLQSDIDRQNVRGLPMGDYARSGGELAGIMTVASNLLIGIGDPWPLGCTTVERPEDDERMVYSKAWTADAGAPEELVTRFDDVEYHWGGTSGTILWEKTRQADGKRMESITAHASESDLTVLFQDDFGSIQYTLPLVMTDEHFPRYQQPIVVCTGDCRMDVEGFERVLNDLPGERQSQWVIEAQTQVSDAERFTLLRDTCHRRLCHEVLRDGQWRTDWTNDRMIEDHCEAMGMRFTPGEAVQQTGRFTRAVRDVLSIFTEGEHPNVWIDLSRDASGAWQVDTVDSKYYMEHAYLMDDCALVQDSALSVDSHALLVPAPIARQADSFNARDVFEAHMALQSLFLWDFDLARREPYVRRGLMPDYADVAGAEVLYANPCYDRTVPVHACPDASAPRAANGKAAVSLAAPVAFLCREGDWLMVLYETDQGRHRTGWIDSRIDPFLRMAAAYAMPADFALDQAQITKKTALIDDPIDINGSLCTLKKGAGVTILARCGGLAYAEATVNGKRYRGYVETSCLTP